MRVDYNACNEFLDEANFSFSSITRPKDHSIMFIMLKIQDKIQNLRTVNDCFVFLQKGIVVPKDIEEKHWFCETEDSSIAYAKYVQDVYGKKEVKDRQRKYEMTAGGFTVGENVEIGDNTCIEPGAFLDHDIVVGKGCVIRKDAILRHCIIGNSCTIQERSFIGNKPYTYHTEGDHLERTIAVGKVILEDRVDVGAYTMIDRGSVSDTVIREGTKIDSNVYVGHDVFIGKNVEITSGSLIGGFSEIGDDAKIYTSNIMKRTNIGSGSIIGFNSGVISDVKMNVEVFGYPSRVLKNLDK